MWWHLSQRHPYETTVFEAAAFAATAYETFEMTAFEAMVIKTTASEVIGASAFEATAFKVTWYYSGGGQGGDV